MNLPGRACAAFRGAFRHWPVALILAVAVGLVGCGSEGDTTTIIESAPTKTVAEASDVFVQDPVGRRAAQPSEISFSVTGDLIGTGLSWDGWGSPTATGAGDFVFNPAPHTKQVTGPGTVELSDL